MRGRRGRARTRRSSRSRRLRRDLLAELPALGRDRRPRDAACSSRWTRATCSRRLGRARARGARGARRTRSTASSSCTGPTRWRTRRARSALLLGPLPKPVVLTGAQRPLAEARTDARENLIDAALVATLPVPEVTIAFASRALRGVRATKRDAWAFDAFDSPNCAPLVELGVGVDGGAARAPRGAARPVRRSHRAARARGARLSRARSGAGTRRAARRRAGASSSRRTEPGTCRISAARSFPRSRRRASATCRSLVVSQCLRGFVDMTRYAGGAAAKAAGAISGGDMTVEAAIAKLMIGLARHGDRRRAPRVARGRRRRRANVAASVSD